MRAMFTRGATARTAVTALACLTVASAARQGRQLAQLAGTPIVANITDRESAKSASVQKAIGDFATLNSQIPVNVHVNCHYGPDYVGPRSASAAAADYLKEVRYRTGDDYEPTTRPGQDDPVFKQPHNESWSLGITFSGKCILSDDHPTCEYTFGPFTRGSGTTTIRNPKPEAIKFVDCALGMDGSFANSTTCFQEADLTRINLAVKYKEQSISAITFFSRFNDTSADGPAGEYELAYTCQFLFNAFEVFNPIGNVVGVDPRLASFNPNIGQYGPPGNGGNIGAQPLPDAKGVSGKVQKGLTAP